MKNFDLDQIKDRQLYKMPDQFYEKMQQNVLEKTISQTETITLRTKSKNNWYYAAAASLAIIFGGVFLFQDNTVVENPNLISNENVVLQVNPNIANQDVSGIVVREKKGEEPAEILSFSANTDQNNSKPIAKNEPKIVRSTAKKSTEAVKTEDQIDFLLENFTAEELATLAKNSDKDIYLDLYN